MASHKLSSPTCNTEVQLCKSSSQPSVSDCQDLGIRSPLSAYVNSTFACGSSLSVPFQVVPGLGSSAAPTSTACDSTFRQSSMLSSKLPNLPPFFKQKVGCSLLTSDAVGMGSEKGMFVVDSARCSQQAEEMRR